MYGISADKPEKQKKFKDKYHLPYHLLADPEKKVIKSYGVLQNKMLYGNTFLGIERTTFVIDPEGRIARIFSKVKPQGHAEEVLAELKK